MTSHSNEDNLQNLLKKIEDMTQQNKNISVDDILEVIGRRAFGPLLVLIGLFLAIPGASDIPGVPIVMGGVIILTLGQQLIGRKKIWLPNTILDKSVKQSSVKKSLSYANKPAKFIDAITTSRLQFLVENPTSRLISTIACISIALLTPAMTIVLLSANVAGVCLLLFGISYIARDGLVMLLSYAVYFGLLATLLLAFI